MARPRARVAVLRYARRTMSDTPQTQVEKSWQARIGEATDAIAQTFVESISYD